ncbi:BadF/BadG/BcrA/BcrD ATPase family protein [Asticcacaulis sp. 201]|uniref:BadF/BadG/BcrA/BcrD ATPase family protein n=1 Tax=Asticcacaulis sp. 201 TaxID=3028787 RepID=UPI002916A1FD|nr:BadF/BadG/BcrA/BcrD ATPase family protein [Asticcacaulis sp. 201]MDV6332638.1 BadF/BadG/BcrA/BcrD ATPase family protein [Asticcacaulis sp. 201]
MTQSDPRLSLFAGVDGGGTKCRVRLRNAEGVLLGEAESGPANIRLGLNLVWANILGALDQTLVQAGHSAGDWERISIGLGLAGISSAEDAENTIKAGPRFGRCDASSDAHTACLGAFSGRDGGILISGTGSAAYAWVQGRGRQIGGWGFEVCDNGSAADLGRMALRVALEGHDGLAPQSDFGRAIISHFGGHPTDIVHWVTNAKPRDYGTLAPMVMSFADKGDPVAVSIVQKSADDLARYINRLHAVGANRVCLVGGMGPIFAPWINPQARSLLADAEHDAMEGALLMAHGVNNGLTAEQVVA